MSYLTKSKKSGFTLLEMLLVIAIIAILASIVIVAINPAKQIGDANNAQRNSDVLAILNAIHQYQIDNSGSLSSLSLPTGTSCEDNGEFICIDSSADCEDEANSYYDDDDGLLFDYLVDDDDSSYLSAIPRDPGTAASSVLDTDNSAYRVVQNSSTNRITVCAPLAENGETIEVTR